MGMSKSGRIALLCVAWVLRRPPLFNVIPPFRTNITEEIATYASSRGELASAYLLSSLPLDDYTQRLTAPENWRSYAGFNLLLLTPITSGPDQRVSYEGVYVTNSGGGGRITGRPLTEAERVYGGISNGVDSKGGSEWPKVMEGRAALSTALAELRNANQTDSEAIVEHLDRILRCTPLHLGRDDI